MELAIEGLFVEIDAWSLGMVVIKVRQSVQTAFHFTSCVSWLMSSSGNANDAEALSAKTADRMTGDGEIRPSSAIAEGQIAASSETHATASGVLAIGDLFPFHRTMQILEAVGRVGIPTYGLG